MATRTRKKEYADETPSERFDRIAEKVMARQRKRKARVEREDRLRESAVSDPQVSDRVYA